MPKAIYQIQIIDPHRPFWRRRIRRSIAAEAVALGLPSNVKLVFRQKDLDNRFPLVCLALLDAKAHHDPRFKKRVRRALKDGHLVIPIIDDLADMPAFAPKRLRGLNAWEWKDKGSRGPLAHLVFEELGLTDKTRSAFISHRRADGQAAAELLHDKLSHTNFTAFIDRYAIRPGRDVQQEIANGIEQYAFVVVLETPEAHTSDWLRSEVEYALAHSIGVLMIRWPDTRHDIPGTGDLPRHELRRKDLKSAAARGQTEFTQKAIERILRSIEFEHALAVVRRRKNLLTSVQDAARNSGAKWLFGIKGVGGV